MSLGSPVPTCKKHLKHLPHSIRNQIRQQHCSGICGVSLHRSTRTFRVKTVRPEEGHLPSCLEKEQQNPQSGETNENKHFALAALAALAVLWSFNCQLMSCPVQISMNERMTIFVQHEEDRKAAESGGDSATPPALAGSCGLVSTSCYSATGLQT